MDLRKLIIRPEQESDYHAIKNVIKSAFENMHYSDQKEHLLVEKLRHSDSYIPELSLVAIYEDELIGHITLSRAYINDEGQELKLAALAPVSVRSELQGKGIGSSLIHAVHNKASEMGYDAIVLIGDPGYYKRFGYQLAKKNNVTLGFDIPSDYWMIKFLNQEATGKINGTIVYDEVFHQ